MQEQQAKSLAQMQKLGDEEMLAELDNAHKLMLVSDAQYFREKVLLHQDEIDADLDKERASLAALEALKAKQHGEKGGAAHELETDKSILEVKGKINELTEKSAVLQGNYRAAEQERAAKNKLESLQLAAALEEQTNTTITARLALMRAENALEIQKATAEGRGGDGAVLQQLEAVKEAKLQIADVDRQLTATENTYKLAVEELNDAAAKDPRFKRAAAQQINQLTREEAAAMKQLVAEYDALAQTLGGEFLEKAKALHAELDKLNTPSQKGDAQFAKTLGEGFQSMAEQMSSASLKGGKAFHQMAEQVEQDIVRLAIKLAMQKWLTPALTGLFGGGSGGDGGDGMLFGGAIPGYASGGDYGGGPMVVGENGPELMFPSGPGSVTPNSVLSKISEGGGGASPSVTMNVINNSSQPVTARQGPTSFDSDSKAYIIHTILEDQAQGGPISQAMQGFGR